MPASRGAFTGPSALWRYRTIPGGTEGPPSANPSTRLAPEPSTGVATRSPPFWAAAKTVATGPGTISPTDSPWPASTVTTYEPWPGRSRAKVRFPGPAATSSAASLMNRAVPPSRATWPKPVRVDSSELMEVPRTRLTSLARCTSRRLSWSLSTARVTSATPTLSNKSATKAPTGNRWRDAERRGSSSWAGCGRFVVALRSNGVTRLVASPDGLAPEVVRAGDNRSFPLHARFLPDHPTRRPTVRLTVPLGGNRRGTEQGAPPSRTRQCLRSPQ